MTDKQRKYAIDLFLKKTAEDPEYSEKQFAAEVQQHIDSSGSENSGYDSFELWSQIDNLWKILNMTPAEIVTYADMKMSEFSERFAIPYRTLQSWCNGTNPFPVYIRILICEGLGILDKTTRDKRKRRPRRESSPFV